ncbi:MAG: hypothetical protein H7Z19_16170, partial [Chitinophagaceae bacterium]|nr:hypothetical protein [Rubrivivax sp.]
MSSCERVTPLDSHRGPPTRGRWGALKRWFLGVLMLGLGACALAQPDTRGDDGDYQILQARYGTPSNHVDVTERLKELARQDRSFRMGNDSFGVDPHPDQVKTLRIFARGKDGRTRTFEYAEGSVVDGAQFSGWGRGNWGQGGWNGGWGGDRPGPGTDDGQYQILQARYGTASRHI